MDLPLSKQRTAAFHVERALPETVAGAASPVDRLVQEFRERWARGERRTAEEFLSEHPELLIDAGAAIALATDFNPGSAYCESLPLVCSLACTQLGLSPAEALGACTVNAAHVLGRADRIGRLAPGYGADVTLLDAIASEMNTEAAASHRIGPHLSRNSASI